MGELLEAKNSYQKVLKIQHNHVNAHYNLALLFKVMGDFCSRQNSRELKLKKLQKTIKNSRVFNRSALVAPMSGGRSEFGSIMRAHVFPEGLWAGK